jgi:IS5 family transposase
LEFKSRQHKIGRKPFQDNQLLLTSRALTGQQWEKMKTPEAQAIYRERKRVAEFPNLCLKEKFGLRRFRVRGLVKATCEAIWACLTYNIQQWVRLRWRPNLAAAMAT